MSIICIGQCAYDLTFPIQEPLIENQKYRIMAVSYTHLLASGYSRRFQGNKLLYELDGMPLIAHTLQKLSALKPHSLIVVTQYEEVEKLANDYNAVVVFNTQAREGQSSSIRLGIKRSDADQAMLCVADQPYLRLEKMCIRDRNEGYPVESGNTDGI